MSAFKLLGITDSLLIPIQRAIATILPDFLEAELEKPETRETMIEAADKVLVSTHPEAKLIAAPIRKRLIGRFLDIMLDDILLSD